MEETEKSVSRIKRKMRDIKNDIFKYEDEIAYLISQRNILDILDTGIYLR